MDAGRKPDGDRAAPPETAFLERIPLDYLSGASRASADYCPIIRLVADPVYEYRMAADDIDTVLTSL